MGKLVSIITPMYNSEIFIEATYNSIKEQEYKNWEWIVIDDKSTDNSVEIIKNIRKLDSRVILLENKSKKFASGSRNKGLKKSKGEYIAFIDSDDLWGKKFLEIQIKYLKEKKAGIVFSAYERKSFNLKKTYGIYVIPLKVKYKDLLKSNYLSCLTVLYSKKKVGDIYFDEKLKLHEDYVFWLEILKRVKVAYGNPQRLAIYRIREGSSSRNKLKNLLYMIIVFYKIEKLGLFKTLFYLINYVYFGIKKNKNILMEENLKF